MAFPDVNQLLIAYLTPILAPDPVESRVRKPRPDRFIQVRRVGGSTSTVQDRARIDVIAWATTDPEAMGIALTARAAIWALPGTTLLGSPVYRVVEFLGPRLDDDQEFTGRPRAWATYELAVRADDLIQPAPSISP